MSDSGYRLQPGDYRQQFADFLDRLASGAVSSEEWSSFVITHYNDKQVENARRMTARMGCGYIDVELDSDPGRDRLRTWAELLRASNDA